MTEFLKPDESNIFEDWWIQMYKDLLKGYILSGKPSAELSKDDKKWMCITWMKVLHMIIDGNQEENNSTPCEVAGSIWKVRDDFYFFSNHFIIIHLAEEEML